MADGHSALISCAGLHGFRCQLETVNSERLYMYSKLESSCLGAEKVTALK
jgi:hypothetical protein